jgi:LysM domain
MQDDCIDDRKEGVVAVSAVHRSRADREERLLVALSPVPDWGRRVRVLLAAGMLLVSAAAAGTAVASEPDGQQEGVVVPEPGPSLPDDVDQGSTPETTLPDDVDPVLTDPQGDVPQGGSGPSPGGSGDGSDDSGPIEAEPVDDPDGGLLLTDPSEPGGPDSGSVPVSPTEPAPLPGTPVAPDDRGAAPEGAPLAPKREAANRARWRASAKQPRVPRQRLTGKLRPSAESPAGGSEPPTTDTPAGSSVPVAAAPSVAAPLGPGRFHVVRPGESLWSIAKRLLDPGASDSEIALEVRRLWQVNAERIGTGDPSLLRVGVRLRVR